MTAPLPRNRRHASAAASGHRRVRDRQEADRRRRSARPEARSAPFPETPPRRAAAVRARLVGAPSISSVHATHRTRFPRSRASGRSTDATATRPVVSSRHKPVADSSSVSVSVSSFGRAARARRSRPTTANGTTGASAFFRALAAGARRATETVTSFVAVPADVTPVPSRAFEDPAAEDWFWFSFWHVGGAATPPRRAPQRPQVGSAAQRMRRLVRAPRHNLPDREQSRADRQRGERGQRRGANRRRRRNVLFRSVRQDRLEERDVDVVAVVGAGVYG